MTDAATFDLLIIGAGPGGMAAATRAAMKGLTVGLVNGQRLWGYGIHGAYKSKGMYELAKDHLVASKPNRGYTPARPQVDFSQVQVQLLDGSHELERMYLEQIEILGITEIQGFARFVDPRKVEVEGQVYAGKNILIATGTKPRWLGQIQQDGRLIMSSDQIVNLSYLPKSMTILGAGVIGCEFAAIMNSFGCRITLLDSRPSILAHEDTDIAQFLETNFAANGIQMKQQARLKSMEVIAGEVVTELESGEVLRSETALVAIGRTPCTGELNLSAAGVETDSSGNIPINAFSQTNIDHIYAAGDVALRDTGLDLSLVHVAEAEGHQAVHHILGAREAGPVDHIPFIIFTIPLIAGAGESEKSAREKYGDVRVARLDNVRNHRAHAMRSFAGFVKLIVGPEGDDRILGVRACGPQADTLIGEVSLCIQNNLPYTYLMDAVHAHPSLSESLHNAARMLAGLYPTG